MHARSSRSPEPGRVRPRRPRGERRDGPDRASIAGRVGPNAVVQTRSALEARVGGERTAVVFAHAGLTRYLEHAPAAMIPESEAASLFAAVYACLPAPEADAVMHDAGVRTARYLLAHRIPTPVQALLVRLPPSIAARVLMSAVGRHAWTFAGSGRFRATGGARGAVEIDRNPLRAPGCLWHVGVFETLNRTLVSPRATVRHCHTGVAAHTCRFEFDLAAPAPEPD